MGFKIMRLDETISRTSIERKEIMLYIGVSFILIFKVNEEESEEGFDRSC